MSDKETVLIKDYRAIILFLTLTTLCFLITHSDKVDRKLDAIIEYQVRLLEHKDEVK